MKYNFFLQMLIVILLSACGAKKQRVIPYDTEITQLNAKEVKSFENTPESVAMYFYASMIRKDNMWEKVCPPSNKRSDVLKRGIQEYTSWEFTKYHFVSNKKLSDHLNEVTIYFSIIYKGEMDDGEDELTIEMIDGKWLIIDVPS